jgi:hypothetical protein
LTSVRCIVVFGVYSLSWLRCRLWVWVEACWSTTLSIGVSATQSCVCVGPIPYWLRCSVFWDALVEPSGRPLFRAGFATPFTDGSRLWFLFPWTVFHPLLAVKVELVSAKLNAGVEVASCVLGTCTTGSLCLVGPATFGVRLLLSFLSSQVWYLVGRWLYAA